MFQNINATVLQAKCVGACLQLIINISTSIKALRLHDDSCLRVDYLYVCFNTGQYFGTKLP
ncbi:MAG: hypothetical protein COW01_02285 [Bdellovibrionales bacterium CG12_big_fil_rev_8_21_14_0_65_38_15]|nr:MAG: hypothetical protein COW79_02520 [Bdellovibrionales bacterium CG22_combo_CG10-13_8_21_14_all_38_13]PIQ57135.1 MAG: hypothetical protein COW01_02285 [Bdellovibrionales bacterium CG12_big_fil_rev_8_21_14_0_65_38_15]PIR30165.1 MAG: hypothetical protein COV38_07680 [Bdellovibrionales bacterium CG11_big_fil_rev_8_21_14_0_20_38_13]